LTSQEIEAFNNEAKIRWRNKFRAKSRQVNLRNHNELALELLDEMRAEKLNINSQQMETDFSNGEYYYLSDKLEIGWLQDWERKYK